MLTINLKEYGWESIYECDHSENEIPARITEVHRNRYKASCCYGEIYAKLKGTFYKDINETENVPVVGDYVYLQYNSYGDSQIVKICNRKSKFSRVDYSGHVAGYVKTVKEQLVAANFDYVFILVSMNHDFNLNRIERYLSAALQSGGKPVVILTKADICEDVEYYVESVKELSERNVSESSKNKLTPEFDVKAVSAVSGYGLDSLSDYMKAGKTIVFLGSSGVGKSSLVNAIAGSNIMNVNTIRENDSKGRHTTTHRQLIIMPSKAMIIDTPGMRELGMWDSEEGIHDVFTDISELTTQCKFHNCSHEKEPGCAILQALKEGTLKKERWDSYCLLLNENEWGRKRMSYTKKEKPKKKDKLQKK